MDEAQPFLQDLIGATTNAAVLNANWKTTAGLKFTSRKCADFIFRICQITAKQDAVKKVRLL